MTATGEIERLNKLGRDAAERASWDNHVMNQQGAATHFDHASSFTSDRHHMPLMGRLAVSVLVWGALKIAFFALSLPQSGLLALAVLVLIELTWWLSKKRRATKLRRKSLSLQKQLHDLKQQEFELRYAQAQQDDTLDRWSKE